MKRFLNDLQKYYSYEVRSAKTSLKTEVASSYLNWIWWILEPLFTMIIYYIIFGIVFQSKEKYFTSFLFVGQTMWNFFNKNVLQSVRMIKRNKGIVSKVYIPKFILLIANMMVNGFKMAISWVIVLLMMAFTKVEFSTYMIYFVPLLLILFLITFAVCVNLMHFGVFVEDLGNVINIVMQLMFFMTGIMYNIDTRLGTQYPMAAHLLTYYNPVALVLRDMRNALLYQTAPEWGALAIWTIVAIVLSVIGVRTIYKNENSYVKVI